MMDNTSDLDTDDDARSTDSINITTVKERVIDDDRICYLCANAEGGDDVYDRSDLMDGGRPVSYTHLTLPTLLLV